MPTDASTRTVTEDTSTTRGPPWVAVGAPPSPLEGPIDTDVLVIGAGLTGLSTAYHLGRGGARVALLDDRPPPGGASGRSAGLVLTGTGQHLSRSRLAIGDEATAAILRLSLENLRILREIAERGCGEGTESTGSLRLALSPREIVELERSAKVLEEEGIAHRMVGRVEARHLSGAALASAGLYIPGDMVLDPAHFSHWMRAAIDETSIIFRARVLALEDGVAGRMVARTASHPVTAEMVVLATEAWSPSLLPELADRVVPSRVQALAVDPAGTEPGRLPAVTNFGHEAWRIDPGGRLLLTGGREASEKTEWILSEETGVKVQAALEKFLGALFPGLAGRAPTHRWAGAVAFACDEVPLIGPVSGSRPVLVGAGYGGWGTSLGLAAGKRLADLVLEGRCADSAVFSPRRFQE